MTRVRVTKRGFPRKCSLPDALAKEVLTNTNRNTRRACKVCIDMADKTKVYRENCPWYQAMKSFTEK